MERLLESVAAGDPAQALGRAESFISNSGDDLVRLFGELFGAEASAGFALHLGSRSGETTLRFARACPGCSVHGVEGATGLVELARAALATTPQVNGRVRFIEGTLPGVALPRTRYDILLADGLLHHMEDPHVLWNVVRRHGAAGAPVLCRDLRRPVTHAEAVRLVQEHAGGEPEIVQRDLLSSLHAAFEIEEIEHQLRAAHLQTLQVRPMGDMRVVIWGRLLAAAMIGA
jgi:hypothetical protein